MDTLTREARREHSRAISRRLNATLRALGQPNGLAVLPTRFVDALADGLPIDRADGSARNLSETEALEAWRAGHVLRVRQ